MKKHPIRNIVLILLWIAALYWFLLPPINPLSGTFWRWLFWVTLPPALIYAGKRGGLSGFSTAFVRKSRKKKDVEDGLKQIHTKDFSFFPVIIIVVAIVFSFLSWDAFHVGAYSSRMVPVDGSASDLPTSDDVNHISLMDTSSAKILGDRVIGSLSDVVSQFEVSSTYTTLVYKDAIIKAAPLEYGGIFKYFNNFTTGTPGYVTVDTQTFDASFVRTEHGIRYSPSAYFLDYLERHIRFQYPALMLGDSSFEIDESGNPYWITSVYGHKFLFGGAYIKGAIITDACTGESHFYEGAANVPEWVDNVYTGEFVSELYNSYGILRNGWFNSWIGQKGCLKTTNDFGYLAKGNDLYIYTGITSVASDESNLGFIMVDARTGQCAYVECAGAEEYSAMSAAQGVVQDYGYEASFPSLVTVDGVPSYALVLKDSAGLVKEYAVVNVNNYTIVSVSSTFNGALKDYSKKLASGAAGSQTSDTGQTKTLTFKVKNIIYADNSGNTYAYLVDENDVVYKIAVASDETVVTIAAGDTVEVEYPESSDGQAVISVASVTKKQGQ